MVPSLSGCSFPGCPSTDSSKDTFHLLFESERGADVTLLIGCDGSQERVPAHSWVLAYSNDYFKTLFNSALRDSKLSTFVFPDDQPAAFINLIRWLYGCGCCPEGTQSALDTLEVAIKYLCPDLVHHVVKHLSRVLKPSSVLQVLAWGEHYVNSCDVGLPSAPPLSAINGASNRNLALGRSNSFEPPVVRSAHLNKKRHKWQRRTKSESECCHSALKSVCSSPASLSSLSSGTSSLCSTDPTFCCRELVSRCLALIDANAPAVLSSQMIECLPPSVLTLVLCRDSLVVPSEVLVMDALYRWSTAECRRQHKPLTLTGRREVLARMLTLPRLLTMSSRETSKKMEELYSCHEIAFVKAYPKHEQQKIAVPLLFVGYLEHLASPRCSKSSKKNLSTTLYRRFSGRDFVMDLLSVVALLFD